MPLEIPLIGSYLDPPGYAHNVPTDFIGRSMERSSQIARSLGYLNCPQKAIIKPRELKRFKDFQLCLIISGSQGQETSSLTRYAAEKHKILKPKATDKIIYSTDIIPGNEQAVFKVIDKLVRLGTSVVYQETTDDLHVSGHASAAEQQLVGWPLPASDVDLTESMRSRVATFFSAGTSKARSRGIGFSRAQMADVRLLIVSSPVAPSGGPTIPRAGTSQACEVRPPGESRPVRLAVGRAPC